MLEGNILKNMIIFCIPLILTNYIQILYSAADMMVVGKFGSDEALSGVTACTTLINLIVNFFLGLSVGINVIVSNRIGANDQQGAQNGVNTAVFLALIGGLVSGFIGFTASKSILVLMNTPAESLSQAVIYIKIYFLGVPGILMTNFGSSVLRSTGDTQRPLYFMIISGLANVVLNLILVIVFHLNAAGVAIATTVSNYISAILIFISLTKIDGVCRLYIKKIKFHLKTALDILRIGVPSGINSCLYAFSNTIIQSTVNSFGQYAVSGGGVATNVDNFLSLSLSSVYHAAMTFMGQNHGAKKYKRIRPIFYNAILLNILVWISIGSVLLIFQEPILYLFSNNKEVVKLAMIKVSILIPSFVLGGFSDTATGSLRGLGYSTVPMFVSLIGVCAFRVFWVFYIFPLSPTLETLYFSFPVSWFITGAANIIIYFFISHKTIKKLKSEEKIISTN